MKGNHHKSQEVSLLIAEVTKMSADDLQKFHGITINSDTNEVLDEVTNTTYKSIIEWANSVYEDEPVHNIEKINKTYGFDDD